MDDEKSMQTSDDVQSNLVRAIVADAYVCANLGLIVY